MKRKTVISILLAITISSNTLALKVEAYDSVQETIDSNIEKIEELENEKAELQENIDLENSKLEELNVEIQEKENEISSIQNEIEQMQWEIDSVQEEIDSYLYEIEDKNIIIENKQKEINALELKEKEQRELLEKRIVNYYKMDISTDFTYLLITSKNLSDFFTNLNGIIKIMNADKLCMQKARELSNNIQLDKEELQKEIDDLELQKLEVEEKQNVLLEKQEEIILVKEKEREGLNYLYGLESEKLDVISSLEEQSDYLEGEITDLLIFNSELQAELDGIVNDTNQGNQESQGSEYETFLRPTPGYITCPFGPRIDPISGAQGYHNGVDFGDWYGVEIKSTKSGTVEYAGWISGYGLTVIVNHGNGVQSLYAHCQELYVYPGQYVERGEAIAEVGTTGYSTGPHLHFEIRFDGVPVDPMDYVGY